jgi:hypothetical protein
MEGMVLKPQDVYVTLKIVAAQSDRAPYSQLAAELVMSPSEVHASVQRAQSSHLLHGPRLKTRPNFRALEEFLLHGLKYVFPPERGELVRGVPTSYAAEPLYKTAPIAALRAPSFYEYLVLADALRDGRVRERETAERELCRRLREANERLNS